MAKQKGRPTMFGERMTPIILAVPVDIADWLRAESKRTMVPFSAIARKLLMDAAQGAMDGRIESEPD